MKVIIGRLQGQAIERPGRAPLPPLGRGLRRRLGQAGARLVVAFAALGGLAGPLPAAAADDPLPAELFFKRPAVRELELSPSGRRLAVSTEVNGRVGVFVIDLQAEDFRASRAALFPDADIRHFAWVDDDRLVFNAVDLQSGLGEDQRVAPGLFAVRHDGTELRQLVSRHGESMVRSGDRGRSLAWNHVLLHVPVPSEDREGAKADEIIVGELHFRGKDLQSVEPMWLNTRTGRTRGLDTFGRPRNAVRWWFSPQGVPRAVVTGEKGREAIHWYRLPREGAAGQWMQLAEAPAWDLPFVPTWAGSGELLFVKHRTGPDGAMVLSPFDFERGVPGPARVVVPGFDLAGQVIGDRDGGRLVGVRVNGDAEQTVWFDEHRKALQQRVDAALPDRSNRLTCRRCGAPDAVAVVSSWSDRHPGQLLLWRQADQGGRGQWRGISVQQPGVDPQRMATLDLVRIRARDGRDLPVWVTRPAAFKPGQPLPAVVLVPNGPWQRHGHWRWDPMAQFLASRGYVIIEPEVRGSDGYGAAHLRAGDKQWGQAMQDDVADALRWAQAEKIASDKACIAGPGYGGYSALMGLIRDPALYRCGSAWFAIADLLLYVEGGWFVSDGITDFGRRYLLPARVGDPDKDRDMLLAHSPVEQAHRLRAPLQLIYGSDDRRVPIAHGKRLRSAMQKAGLEPEWIVYEDEAHGLRKAENQVDLAKKVEAFLARHLK